MGLAKRALKIHTYRSLRKLGEEDHDERVYREANKTVYRVREFGRAGDAISHVV